MYFCALHMYYVHSYIRYSPEITSHSLTFFVKWQVRLDSVLSPLTFLQYNTNSEKLQWIYARHLCHSLGEPERAPHKREVRAISLFVCLSICLSVRTFMTRKYTTTVLIYGYLQLLIAAFKAGLVHWFVHQHSTNM